MSIHNEVIDLMNENTKLKAEREKLIGALFKIKRDIYEPDKIYIHLSRALGKALEEVKGN